MLKAAIIGDGIMGRLLAFELINAGCDVTLYSDGKHNTCSMAAAGLLTPLAELEKNDLNIFELGLDALTRYWPEVLNKLYENIYFRQLGSLVLSHPNDHSDLERFVQVIQKKLNLPNYYQLLNKEEIHQLEPDLSNFLHGYYFACEGQIDNQTLLQEIEYYLKSKKLTWVNQSVTQIRPGKIRIEENIYYFDIVFDCRGLGAKEVFPNLRGIRGELIWLHAPNVSLKRPIRYLHPRYSLYIAPRPNSIYVVGASEIETDDDSPISVRTALELLTATYCVQPKFIEARIIKTFTQCRPTLPDHLPKIKYANQFIAINGLYRHGFLIAPTLAKDVMKWLQHGISSVCYPQLFEKFESLPT